MWLSASVEVTSWSYALYVLLTVREASPPAAESETVCAVMSPSTSYVVAVVAVCVAPVTRLTTAGSVCDTTWPTASYVRDVT